MDILLRQRLVSLLGVLAAIGYGAAPAEAFRDQGGYFTKPAVAEDGTIYVGARDRYVYAFDPDPASADRIKWFYLTGKDVLSNPAIAPTGTPAAGTIYFGSNDHAFYALNPDGTLQWQHECDGRVEGGPTVDPRHGRIYVGSMEGFLYAFHPDQPAHPLKWALKMPYKDIKTIPILSHDGTMVYVGSDRRGFYRIGSTGVLQGTFDTDEFYRIGGALDRAGNLYISDHHKIVKLTPALQDLWTYAIDQNHRSHPILSPDELTVYQGSRGDNHLHAINADTGIKQWMFQTDGNVVATGAVHPHTGAIYIGAFHGRFYAVHPDGTMKWSRSSLSGTGFRSTPALSRDLTVVYIGDEVGVFYALDAETGAVLWAFDTRTAEGRVVPVVDAGPDQRVVLSGEEVTLTLRATVSDDGLPDPPGQVRVKWTLDEGPDKVKFSDPKELETTAIFETPGEYTIVATADDGENLSDDDVLVIIDPAGADPLPLTVSAGDDQVGTLSLTQFEATSSMVPLNQLAGFNFTASGTTTGWLTLIIDCDSTSYSGDALWITSATNGTVPNACRYTTPGTYTVTAYAERDSVRTYRSTVVTVGSGGSGTNQAPIVMINGAATRTVTKDQVSVPPCTFTPPSPLSVQVEERFRVNWNCPAPSTIVHSRGWGAPGSDPTPSGGTAPIAPDIRPFVPERDYTGGPGISSGWGSFMRLSEPGIAQVTLTPKDAAGNEGPPRTYQVTATAATPTLAVDLTTEDGVITGIGSLFKKLKVTLTGTAKGLTTVNFDCDQADGTYQETHPTIEADLGNIPPQNSYTSSMMCTYTNSGTAAKSFTAKVEVKRQGLIKTDTLQIAVNPSSTPKPDLIVTDIMASPYAPTAISPVTFSVTVKNQGTAAVASTASFVVDIRSGGTRTTATINGPLAVGASKTAKASVALTFPQGSRTIQTKADNNGQIQESNEDNNDDKTLTLVVAATPTQTIVCEPIMNLSSGKWSQRWGAVTAAAIEPLVHACSGGTGKSGRLTTSPHGTTSAAGIEWFTSTPGASRRNADVSFRVPSFRNWNHLAAMAAFEPPSPPLSVGFGRIGGAVFQNQLYVEFLSREGWGCDSPEILYNPVTIPGGGLQTNHWYRLDAQIKRLSGGEYEVKTLLLDLQQTGAPTIASTAKTFPASCMPGWYSGTTTRWLIGVLSTATGVQTIVDDFSGRADP